jgi:hypothetical protein
MTFAQMEVRALSILKHLKVRVIVIDEVHNLLRRQPARTARHPPAIFGV